MCCKRLLERYECNSQQIHAWRRRLLRWSKVLRGNEFVLRVFNINIKMNVSICYPVFKQRRFKITIIIKHKEKPFKSHKFLVIPNVAHNL